LIKIKFLHKNSKRCLHEILAIIRTDKLTGRAKLLTNSIKTKTGAKTGGLLGGQKFKIKYLKLKLKPKIKIENQNIKELINIKIDLVKGKPKGTRPTKFIKTKIENKPIKLYIKLKLE